MQEQFKEKKIRFAVAFIILVFPLFILLYLKLIQTYAIFNYVFQDPPPPKKNLNKKYKIKN